MCSSKRGRWSSGDPRGRPVAGAGALHRTTPPRGRPHDKCLPCCPPWPRLSTDSQNTERHKHPQSSATCGAQPDRAKRGSPSERSEVLRPSEARCPLPPRRAKRGVAPEPREGRKRKLGCDLTGSEQTRSESTSCGRRESVLCTYGIIIRNYWWM